MHDYIPENNLVVLLLLMIITCYLYVFWWLARVSRIFGDDPTRQRGPFRMCQCRQSCAGAELSRHPAGRAGDDCHAQEHPLGKNHADRGGWRQSGAVRRKL